MTKREGVTEVSARILNVLERYISPINARVVFTRAAQSAGIDPTSLAMHDVKGIIDIIRRSSQIFVATAAQKPLLDELWAIAEPTPVSAVVVPILSEKDLGQVRLMVRGMCTELRVTPYALQKIATVVSELARNIVKYTATGGKIELSVENGSPRRFVVMAVDQGPGIHNLDEILAGRHKSKTGMGLGLLGTKKLADRFDIVTGVAGTRIVAEFVL